MYFRLYGHQVKLSCKQLKRTLAKKYIICWRHRILLNRDMSCNLMVSRTCIEKGLEYILDIQHSDGSWEGWGTCNSLRTSSSADWLICRVPSLSYPLAQELGSVLHVRNLVWSWGACCSGKAIWHRVREGEGESGKREGEVIRFLLHGAACTS